MTGSVTNRLCAWTGNYKKDIQTSGRARNMENKTNKELGELYKDLDMVVDIKRKDSNGWDM